MLSFKSSRILQGMVERLSSQKRSLQLATPLVDSPSLSPPSTIRDASSFNIQQENSQSKSKSKPGRLINRHHRTRNTRKHIDSLLASTTKPKLQRRKSCRAKMLQKNNEINHMAKALLVLHPTRSILQLLCKSFKSSWVNSLSVSTRR